MEFNLLADASESYRIAASESEKCMAFNRFTFLAGNQAKIARINK